MILLLLILLIAGCAEYQVLEVDKYYKRDIGLEVNGKRYEGVTVIPRANKYEIIVKPKGNMDLILIRSCHREHSFEKKSKKFLWIKLGENKFKYTYNPTPKEREKACPLRVEVYEAKNGRHSWALIDFEHPDYQLPSRLTCNGEIRTPNGVAVCQAKAGLIQTIEFPEIVQFATPDEGCVRPKFVDGAFDWQISKGECLYITTARDGRKHRMTAIGYEGVLVREGQ